MSLTLYKVTETSEGDGVDIKRLFPLPEFMNFDPFVLWDHFSIHPGRGFPEHPHRGFEAITYMFDGGMNHKDNLGNKSFVSAGGAQRFTAGSGIIHSELPASQGVSDGIQLWINLPKSMKNIDPDYQQVEAHEFPLTSIAGGKVKTLVGGESPLKLKTNVIYQHIQLEAKARYIKQLNPAMRGFIYIVKGKANINSLEIKSGQAAFFENLSQIEISSEEDTRFMLCMGLPHGEPIHQHGTFVD